MIEIQDVKEIINIMTKKKGKDKTFFFLSKQRVRKTSNSNIFRFGYDIKV